jgi:hypothetical protein
MVISQRLPSNAVTLGMYRGARRADRKIAIDEIYNEGACKPSKGDKDTAGGEVPDAEARGICTEKLCSARNIIYSLVVMEFLRVPEAW